MSTEFVKIVVTIGMSNTMCARQRIYITNILRSAIQTNDISNTSTELYALWDC